MREGWFFRKGKFTIAVMLILAVAVISCGIASVRAADQQPRYSEKILTPDYLSAQQAQQYLDKLKLGKAEQIAESRKLLLVGLGSDFAKAAVLLEVVDSEDEYVIAKLGASDKVIPPIDKIAAEMGDISIGTFSEPPKGKKDLAIIDNHRKLKVVVLPARRIGDLVRSIQRLSSPSKAVAPAATVAQTNPATTTRPTGTDQPNEKAAEPVVKAAAAPKAVAPVKPKQPAMTKTALEQAADKIRQQQAQAEAEQQLKAQATGKPRPVNDHKDASAIPEDLKAAIDRMLGKDAEAEAATKAAEPVAEVEQPGVTAEPGATAQPPATAEPAAAAETQEPTRAQIVEKSTPPAMPAGLQEAIDRMLAQDKGQGEPLTTTQPPSEPTTITGTLEPQETNVEATKTGQPSRSGMAQQESPDRDSVSVALDATENELTGHNGDEVSYAPPEIPDGNDPLKITLPETMTIEQLLALAGEYLHLDYMYEPQDVKQMVTLKLQGKLRGQLQVKDLYPLMESVLKFKGLVMTRTGNVVSIVPLAKIGEVDPELIIESGQVRHGDVVITRVFTLDHIDTASALNLLTTMKLGVSISQIAENQKLIVTGYTYRMPRIERLLKMIDRPGKPREFRFRTLKYTMAQNLAPTISALAEQLGTVSVSVSVSGTTPTASPAPPGETAAARRARLAREAMARTQAARAGQPTGTTAATPDTVYLDADERTNRILMIGDAGQLEIVEQLIDTLDVAQADLRQMKTYKIKNVDAEEVRRLMAELGVIGASQAQSSRYTSRDRTMSSRTTAGTARTATPPPAAATPAAASPLTTTSGPSGMLVEEPQVVVLEMTNSLLINATSEQHEQLKTIIDYIDQAADEDEIPYKIYPLENQKPEDLSSVLEQLIQETIKDTEGKVQQVVKRQDEEIVIVPDENTFSLIVYASKKNQEWISNLIEQLDKRRPQVLIDVTLVEITKADSFDYDLNILNAVPDMTNWSGTIATLEELTGPEYPASGSDRSAFLEFGSNNTTGGQGFYGDRHINLLLKAMRSRNYGRVLAKPKILVNDNEQGTISTTDTTYVTKTSTTPLGTGGAAGTDTTLIQTGITYDPYDAGITLDITPHISEGELLRLEITLTRSDFLETEDPEKPPNTTTSDLTTIVTVPDESTIILGGMLKMNQSKGGTGVPLLMDIPLLGGLFRSTGNSDRQTKLYVFVRAEILRPDDTLARKDMERISERNRRAFEEAEQEFQSHQDWPGFKPKPVSPVKVLEME